MFARGLVTLQTGPLVFRRFVCREAENPLRSAGAFKLSQGFIESNPKKILSSLRGELDDVKSVAALSGLAFHVKQQPHLRDAVLSDDRFVELKRIAEKNIYMMRTNSLTGLIWSYATLQCFDDSFLPKFERRTRAYLHRFKARDLTTVAHSLQRHHENPELKHKVHGLLSSVALQVIPAINVLEARHMVALVFACNQVGVNVFPTYEAVARRLTPAMVQSLNSHNLARLAHSYTTPAVYRGQVLEMVAEEATERARLRKVSQGDLAILSAAFKATGTPAEAFFSNIASQQ
eukprot:Colp12_sorted_trinity150504_noHs@15804